MPKNKCKLIDGDILEYYPRERVFTVHVVDENSDAIIAQKDLNWMIRQMKEATEKYYNQCWDCNKMVQVTKQQNNLKHNTIYRCPKCKAKARKP